MDRSWTAWLVIVFSVTICVMRQSFASEEMEAVKNMMPRPLHDRKNKQLVEKQLMALFGFSKSVNPRSTLHIPDHMWTLYRKWSGDVHDDTDKLANVVRILHHDDSMHQKDQDSMIFNLHGLPKDESIRRVELHVFKTAKVAVKGKPKASLHAHSHAEGTSRPRRSVVEERHLNTSSSEWEKFEVTSVVHDWLKHRVKEHRFRVEVIDEESRPSKDILVLSKISPSVDSLVEWERKRPFLVIESAKANMKRERRALRGNRGARELNRHGSRQRARKLHEKAKSEMCRRRNFYLDFQSIGWSKQIVHPMGFDMYYCQGTCPKPLGSHMNTTNHAVIQNQVNSFNPTLVPPPCCVPTSLGDTYILFIDIGNQIVMKTYSDIVVEGCGCR